MNSANWHPFVSPNSGSFGAFGVSGILRGGAVAFITYVGFDVVSKCAQETRRPQRDMPIGVLGRSPSRPSSTLAVAAVLTGLVPHHTLNVPDPVVPGLRAWASPSSRCSSMSAH